MEERSLDDFLDADEDDDSDGERDSDVDESDVSDDAHGGDSAEPTEEDTVDADPGDSVGERAADPPVDPAGVEPARSTSQFVPDGATCEACGEPSTRLWFDGDQTVCGSCKPWE